MITSPIPDLVADVMAAADPASRELATSRLERLGATTGGDFAAEIEGKIGAARAARTPGSVDVGPVWSRNGPTESSGHATIIRPATGDNAVYRKFEAFVLQMFVESMLPQNANDLFGKGTAGTVWRSMLAEQIGNEMAKGSGFGIAKQIAKSRAISAEVKNQG